MKYNRPAGPTSPSSSPPRAQRLWVILIFGGVFILLGLLLARRHDAPVPPGSPTETTRAGAAVGGSRAPGEASLPRRSSADAAFTAEEIVASKVSQFGRLRRDLVRSIARRSPKELPAEIERFFDAVESGKWDEIKAQWDLLAKHSGQYESSTNHWDELDAYWPSVLDAYGVAEQAHLWPAQKLLDYGNAILGSLRPGMVYVGGTDNGRWIPELLNETSDGEQHIIVTQNALADARYLDFVNTLYSDRLATLTSDDSQRAFQEYISDAQQRLEHDRQFPDEPKQVRPGEDIQMVDGKAQVSGQVAVMAINERLLQALMQKNPDLSFAVQESFPLRGTYANALPLGPLMELGAAEGQNSFTAEQAAQSLAYWQTAAQQVLADPEAAASDSVVRSYSHDVDSTGYLLAAHDYTAEAEQAYRLAAQLCPDSPESVGDLADLLARTGREGEARQLLQDFSQKHPGLQQDLQRISSFWRAIAPAPPGAH